MTDSELLSVTQAEVFIQQLPLIWQRRTGIQPSPHIFFSDERLRKIKNYKNIFRPFRNRFTWLSTSRFWTTRAVYKKSNFYVRVTNSRKQQQRENTSSWRLNHPCKSAQLIFHVRFFFWSRENRIAALPQYLRNSRHWSRENRGAALP